MLKMIRSRYQQLRRWFTQPESPIPLGWFRVAVAVFCIIKLLVFRESFMDIYGQYGFVQWAITRANLYPGLVHLGDIVLWLGKLGLTVNQSLYIVVSTYAIAIGGLLVGWHTRWMALVVWFINFLWMHAGGGLTYGMDIFTHIALLYCIIMPVGDYLSVDAYFDRRKSQPSVAAGVGRKMLQLHLCIIYLSSGLEKASGIQWRNGEAIWRSLMLPVFQHFDMSWLAQVPWLATILGWQILAIEIGYALLMWLPKTRWLWLLAIVGMHFFIGLLMGMWLFAGIMIILNLGAFGEEVYRDLHRKPKAHDIERKIVRRSHF
jgi:Vitamin K-dependent gamma-carboxylase